MPVLYNRNGIEYGFQQGRIDPYQVYNKENDRSYCPFDKDYMQDLLVLKRDNEDVYDDFVEVYDRTNAKVNPQVFELIENLSQNYEDEELFIKTMVNIYLTMIAEENKDRAILKKRIKRIAIHKILLEDADVRIAVNEHRGVGWRAIAKECEERGF